MEQLHYRPMNASEQEVVRTMIKAFYQHAGSATAPDQDTGMNDEKISRTFEQLQTHPQTGTILVIENQAGIIGYSILINFWSNEYGGIILVIDELYIAEPFRGKGVGSAFLRYLIQSRYNHWVGLKLEVLPYNTEALRLYEKLGFTKSDRSFLLLFE
jgi:ribosomal protein S18 acetylase RimI-like enzyme